MNRDHLKALLGPDGCLTKALSEGEEVVMRVAGDCMEPAICHRASLRLKRPRFLIPGDVVAFYCPVLRGLMVHRFLGYVRRHGVWKLVTMPDRGTSPDPPVDRSAVLGWVVARGGRAYRITPVERLEAIRRYVRWCVRRVIWRMVRQTAC